MLILGIESSCDDTSVALLDCSANGHFVIAEKTASQIEVHKKYGGVVPEIAGRLHAEKIVPLIEQVLGEAAGIKNQELRPDVIAVTAGPGLITGLLVGVEAARTLSYAWNIPLVATNHISGHIHSVEVRIKNEELRINSPITNTNNQSTNQQITFPALALVVSGGHTELVLMHSNTQTEILGRTVDDAAGECFDKIAKLLDLPYPGGPKISKLAATGRVNAIDFPRPMLHDGSYNFSFSGLKTSALYWLKEHKLSSVIASEASQSPENKADSDSKVISKMSGIATSPDIGRGPRNDVSINDFCASFEQAIVDVLVGKTMRAIKQYNPKTIILGGGVAANKKIRETLAENIKSFNPSSLFLIPSLPYCMDNGAMIAVAGYYQALQHNFTSWQNLDVDPQWRVDRPQTITEKI